ncbi:uncharacterized protein AMSG_05436 [Thecamonas trahens ATCC 50062]|uniref:40S ribosomal protein S29 n=1 Tax=Thecamonas trahens ATCC 50062 TaxID=461836 RepID=A0A0L0DB14_THETB|nr:hypothetical protein AMSG_05436 [Thecamonas trahens ATCC 50062]KNC49430.1 hypothetical protein AMSG_05436 [Thecamonas trahens ATCC 50062]|eukprot:XP_013757852.1 hypothetical protein AMSG_05436 [Thecamonas trahens ATCC 50062]
MCIIWMDAALGAAVCIMTNLWRSHPRNFGPGSRSCRVCGNGHAIIRKYGLMICRQCFREKANDIGFHKYR